ncbi:MAG: hypothetical protein EXR07_00935 [Acetobacteraceae bacterium]|nr:hypothetical protein [Acetobacteraceae bacterium]
MRLLRALLAAWLLGLPGGAAYAVVSFDAIAAGDMTATDVILWTRATDDGRPADVTAQIATDPDFRHIVWSAGGSTIADNDFTLKLNPSGLRSGFRYFYRFVADTKSDVGRFTTAPRPNQATSITFAFSGDADGRFRPYPAIADIGRHNLDFFIFNGDTMYETASGRPATVSPKVPDLTPTSNAEDARRALIAYNLKYRQNILGVSETGAIASDGQASLRPLFAATGHYTLLDNHELGNASLQSGGAPQALLTGRNPAATLAFDVNNTGTFHNQTLAFLTLEKSFFNYHPTRIDIMGTPASGLSISGPRVNAPGDPRLHGTARNYFAQRWGKHTAYIQIDDRSYRDARLGTATGGELPAADPRGANPARTMLGATQFAWLKTTLLQAQRAGVTWKFVGISTPMDMVGEVKDVVSQDQKSWYGGYRAERNALLKFIADNAIDHVVFLATDDHTTRFNRLQYETGDGTKALVPGAIHIVTGPIGAGGPDTFLKHDMETILAAATVRTASQAALGQPADGLAGLPGLANVWREFDPEANTKRQPVDFLSPDTFSYTVLTVDREGNLTVSLIGIPSYLPNQNFRKPAESTHKILSFQVRTKIR